MPENPLNVISTGTPQDHSENRQLNSRKNRARELQAKFERLWLTDPERFNPLRNCMERKRIELTWGFITKHLNIVNKQTADIGCGSGVFSRRLRDHGALVEAVDIAENALKQFIREGANHIHLKRDAMPETSLPDHHYDLVVCMELIAELPKEDYRLFFAELSRLIKTNGHLICSSPIDIDTEGGVYKLIELAQTEFDILEEQVSYHALSIRLKRFFEAPSLFIKCWKNPELRIKELTSRRGFTKGWFWLNTTPLFIWPWFIFELCTRPILRFLRNSPRFMLFLERVCRFISDREGISHYLFLAKLRPLQSINPKDMPIQKLGKKEIWE